MRSWVLLSLGFWICTYAVQTAIGGLQSADGYSFIDGGRLIYTLIGTLIYFAALAELQISEWRHGRRLAHILMAMLAGTALLLVARIVLDAADPGDPVDPAFDTRWAVVWGAMFLVWLVAALEVSQRPAPDWLRYFGFAASLFGKQKDEVVIIGAGGHGAVVLEALRRIDGSAKVIVLDDGEREGESFLGYRIDGPRSRLQEVGEKVTAFPAIGDNVKRAELIRWLRQQGRRVVVIVHPSATVSETASLGPGCFVAPGALVNAGAVIGEGVIVNTGASVDHHCNIGFCAHIAPGAHLCGGVQIGARTLIGAGAVVIPGVKIGHDVVVGAGSVVIRDLPNGARVAGCPASDIVTRPA